VDRLDELEELVKQEPDPTRPPLRVTHRLAVPVLNMGEWCWDVTLRYPTFRDLRAAAVARDEDSTAILIERLSNLKGDAIQQLSALDVGDLGEIIADFQERRPEPDPGEPS